MVNTLWQMSYLKIRYLHSRNVCVLVSTVHCASVFIQNLQFSVSCTAASISTSLASNLELKSDASSPADAGDDALLVHAGIQNDAVIIAVS